MEYNLSCYHFTKWVQEGQITEPQFIALFIMNGATILTAVIPNILILVSIWRSPSLHTPATVLLCNLCLSDLSVGSIAQPVLLYWITLERNASAWPEEYCRVAATFGFTSSLFGFVSMLSVMSLGMDRYLALYLHLRYLAVVTMKKAFIACALFWFLGLLVAIAWITFGISVFNILLCIFMAITMGAVVNSYFQIYRIIRKHRSQIQAQELSVSEPSSSIRIKTRNQNIKGLMKSIISSLYIFFSFVLCYTPCFVAFLYFEITRDNRNSPFFIKLTTSIVLTNSSLNPMLYCWKMKDLRQAVKHTLSSCREKLSELTTW